MQRRSGTAVDDLLNAQEPLDETEQEAVLQQFEDTQLSNSRAWKRMFGIGAAALSVVFLHASISNLRYPGQLRYVGEFSSVTNMSAASMMLFLQAASLICCAYSLLSTVPKKNQRVRGCMPTASMQMLVLYIGVLGTCIGALYWSGRMWAMVAKFGYDAGMKWELIWVPIGPVVYAMVCWNIVSVLNSTGKKVLELRGYKYDFKKV